MKPGLNMKALIAGLILTCFMAGTQADCATITWILGETPSLSWGIEFEDPNLGGIITFSGPTDQVYRNKWVAAFTAGGTPAITIDTGSNTIELWYDEEGIPEDVPFLWEPVCGLEITLGPLEDGEWTFFSNNSISSCLMSFQLPPPYVIPEPSLGIFLIIAVLISFKQSLS